MARDFLVVRRSGLIEAEVDGELVGLHIDNSSCYGFNPTATRIWRAIDEPRHLSEICSALMAEFKVSREVCEDQVLAVLENMMEEGLVELSLQPSSRAAE